MGSSITNGSNNQNRLIETESPAMAMDFLSSSLAVGRRMDVVARLVQ